MKKFGKLWLRGLALTLSAGLSLTAAACGAAGGETGTAAETAQSAVANVVNIGVTNEIASLNPFLVDATETGKYATGMGFLPLVDLNQNNEFVGVLAESVSSDDKLTYTIKLKQEAKWSDGQPVTADDVIFTVVKSTSDAIANPSLSTWAAVAGLSESGTHPDAEESVAGVVKLDDQTVQITMKAETPLNTFQNTYLRYLMVAPKHALDKMSTEELKTTTWFNAPAVVSGPYMATDFDGAHFVSYKANANYWMGAPKIETLNIKIVQGSQLLIGLQTGEIDFVHQTMASFAQEDIASLEALENVTVVYDKPLTNQLMFINTGSLTDAKLRLAMAQAIDRAGLVRDFLGGHGEVVEGFLTSYSPYFDASLSVTAFDPEAAKQTLAGVDPALLERTYVFKVNSGDPTFVQAVNLVVQQLAEVGIKAKVQIEDLNTLLTSAGSHDFDMLAVQYTLAPVDPYPDVAWLMTGDNWSQYASAEMDALVADTQSAATDEELKSVYASINRLVQKDLPLINLYVIAAPGAISKRLQNAEPHIYGSFLNVHEWTLK